MKKYLGLVSMILGLVILPVTVSAHVVVKPNEAGVGAFQTFSVGVPVEKDNATTELRLVIPSGLEHVTPNVKPGWTIQVKKEGTPGEEVASEIIWTGGSIPPGQRDEFAFSAKVPSSAGEVQWKAYQTYEDGTVVSWDKSPSDDKGEGKDSGPYSTTKIVDDFSSETKSEKGDMNIQYIALAFSAAALAVSFLALKKKR